MDRNGFKKLSHACQQASSPELNSLFFDPDEGRSSGDLPHHSDTDMVDPTLHTVFANCSSTRGAETIAERAMSLVERTDGEEINVLKSLGDMLSSTMSSLPAAPVKLACAHNGFDLNVVQIKAEGERPTGRFRRKRLNDSHKPAGKWLEHWIDPVHEEDGHSIDSLESVSGCGGKCLLHNGMSALYAQNGIEYAVDDVSGALLDPAMVHAGRATEMDFFNGMKVYDRVPREEQLKTGGKMIGSKWMDLSKGDIDKPNIRCRLAGKELEQHQMTPYMRVPLRLKLSD